MTANPTHPALAGAGRRTALPARLTLRDGRQVLVRTVRPEDKAGLHAAFQRLSEDSRYTRFMASMKDVSDAMLEHATHPAPDREYALVATAQEGDSTEGPIVGGARYAAAPGSDTCEFAVTVVDGWHGLGMARMLMETLIAAARAGGYRRMEGFVLATNGAMRRLARRLGFADTACPDDITVRVVVLDLAAPMPARD